jgi:hypothetical protein
VQDVEAGEEAGLCAEAKRLWEEADMAYCWPQRKVRKGQLSNRRDIKAAARKVAKSRLRAETQTRAPKSGNTPYSQLIETSNWRVRTGTRRQVGLMTTARLGSLMINAGRAADGQKTDPSCQCCGAEQETDEHLIIDCDKLHEPRKKLMSKVKDDDQWRSFQASSGHAQKMTLLGRRMKARQSKKCSKGLDKAVKTFLEEIDDCRTTVFHQEPLNGGAFSTPPEDTMQAAVRFDRMCNEDDLRDSQGGLDPEEEWSEDEEDQKEA